MAKVVDNIVVRGLQGSVGNLVFRQGPRGETWVSRKPTFRENRTFSEGQKAHQGRFQEAAAYARGASKREPIYAELARGTGRSPYSFAVADWFHPPVVHEVRREAGLVRVRASDDVKVARVRVSVLDEDGKVIEKLDAAQVDADWWEVGCDAERVRVEVWDLAGNVGKG
jgi:hypothetical protein